MPSDVVTIAVSAGLGVSVFAGVLSGVCYVLAHGFTRKRSRRPGQQWYCVVCGTYLRAPNPEIIKVVICTECEERVCKQRCSKRDNTTKEWICYNCLKRPTWLQGILNSIRLPYRKFKSLDSIDKSDPMGEKLGNADLRSKNEKECVRDFIEKLVFTIVGGSVDDASIFRMYNDKHYDAFFDRHHQDLSDAITNLSSTLQIAIKNSSSVEQTPSEAHTALKLLIEKILQEAKNLPRLGKPVQPPSTSSEEARTYEKLLATAILNKVVSTKDNPLPWISTDNVSSDDFYVRHHLNGDTRDQKWRELESASNSSLEDYFQSDSSNGSTKYVDGISLTIQQRIEEIPSREPYDDVPSSLQYLRKDNSYARINDQSNWYLQRRQFSGTSSPVPVPMLVPNPLTSAKVLIGDKEIDETSDLSDGDSDLDEAHSEIKNLTINSTLTIRENSYLSDEETSFDSGVREDRDDFNDREKFYYDEHTDSTDGNNENVEQVSLLSTDSNVERDSEYIEKISSVPTAEYHPSTIHTKDTTSRDSDFAGSQKVKKDENLDIPLAFEGIYSKKEKEKWNHPINMPNNPYSEENIRKRIQSHQRYGRDYYTKQAGLPSGKPKSDEANTVWVLEEATVYKAVPATTTDSDSETQDAENYVERNINDENEAATTNNSYLSVTSSYEVTSPETSYTTLEDDETKLQIKVNKKEAFLYHSDDLIEPYSVENVDKFLYSETHNDDGIKFDNIKSKTDENLDRFSEISVYTSVPKINNSTVIETLNNTVIKENQKEKGNLPSAIIAKKSDNTLIKKIYSNPVVRNFALTNRERIPYISVDEINKPKTTIEKNEPKNFGLPLERRKEQKNLQLSLTDKHSDASKDLNPTAVKKASNEPKNLELSSTYSTDDRYSINRSEFISENKQEFNEESSAKHNFSLEFSDNGSLRGQSSVESDDFNELKEKRLVSNRLNEYSRSFPNLTRIHSFSYDKSKRNALMKKSYVRPVSKDDESVQPYEKFVSVKDLKKLFENKDTVLYKDKPVHSLTARSLSKEMKTKLRAFTSTEKDAASPNYDYRN